MTAHREMIDLVCDEKVVDKDYAPLPQDKPFTAEEWRMDCADLMLDLNDADMAQFRTHLREVMWIDKYMRDLPDAGRRVKWSGFLAGDAVKAISYLIQSLESRGITPEHLEQKI